MNSGVFLCVIEWVRGYPTLKSPIRLLTTISFIANSEHALFWGILHVFEFFLQLLILNDIGFQGSGIYQRNLSVFILDCIICRLISKGVYLCIYFIYKEPH